MANTDYAIADALLDQTGAEGAAEEDRRELAALLDGIAAKAPARKGPGPSLIIRGVNIPMESVVWELAILVVALVGAAASAPATAGFSWGAAAGPILAALKGLREKIHKLDAMQRILAVRIGHIQKSRRAQGKMPEGASLAEISASFTGAGQRLPADIKDSLGAMVAKNALNAENTPPDGLRYRLAF